MRAWLVLTICFSVLLPISKTLAKAEYEPVFTYDLGGATGNRGDQSYTEINLGLNWKLTDYFVWRNAVFSRMSSGSETLYGLDTTARFQYSATSQDGRFGLGFFGGPGYRFSKSENSALFAEAGVQFKLGGINLGGGVKYFTYPNPGKDSSGADLAKNDTVYFLILQGGGTL